MLRDLTYLVIFSSTHVALTIALPYF